MQKVLTAEEMREVDRLTTEKYGIPSLLLMENAAHAAANVIKEKLGGSVAGKSFLILCGKGSNGGDGAALGRILWTQGANVSVRLFGRIDETSRDAKVNFEILNNLDDAMNQFNNLLDFCEIDENEKWSDYVSFENSEVVVDALFGTGLTRPIEGRLASVLHNLSGLGANYADKTERVLVISIDLPSGLDADQNQVFGACPYSNLTITFTAPKLANVLPPASNYNGELVVANIGSPQELIDNSPSKLFVAEREDAQIWLNQTKYTNDSYKNKRGHALLVVGSREYSGAAVLAGNAAMLSGVGLTTIATSESAQNAIAAKTLEEIIVRDLPENENGAIAVKALAAVEKLAEKVDVIGIGCGLSSSEKTTKDFVREVVTKRRTPIVIDADALNALSPFDLNGSDELPLILTPHEGEFRRLLGSEDKEMLKDRVKAVRDFAENHHVILVLKGERTLIGAPDGRVVINPTGNSGLGKAGNGDTLTGIITGFIAQAVRMKIDIFETVVAACYVAGFAGDIAAGKIGRRTMLASDVRECLGEAFRQLKIKS